MPEDVPGEGLWVSLSELAALKSVTRQSVSERLKRLEADGVIASRTRGGRKYVLLAAWDVATRDYTDPARLAGRNTSKALTGAAAPTGAADPTYTQELTRKARYDADLKEIELARQRGELVPVAEVTAAVDEAAAIIKSMLDRLPSHAEDVHAASAGGPAAVRRALSAIVEGYRHAASDALTQMHEVASRSDIETPGGA
jgi:hypothetical protein